MDAPNSYVTSIDAKKETSKFNPVPLLHVPIGEFKFKVHHINKAISGFPNNKIAYNIRLVLNLHSF